MNDLRRELDLAHRALDLVAPILRDVAPGRVTSKGDRDLVTETDVAIEHRLRDFLAIETPDIGFLGEEEGHHGSHERFWALDPIDGTSNFLRGSPLCGVSLGLIEGETSVAGVIDLPFLGSRYEAARGQGARADGARISVGASSSLHEAIVAIGDYATGPESVAENRVRLAVTALLSQRAERVRMLGSAAIDLAWMAHGHLDAMLMMSNKPWDTAAGVIIAREAGAKVVDVNGSDHTVSSKTTVAATPALIEEVLALLADAGLAEQE